MTLNEETTTKKWKIYLGIILGIISILGFIGKSFYSALTIEDRMFDNAQQKRIMIYDVDRNTEHRNDKNIHMSYERKVEKFVTRTEYNKTIENINATLIEIKDDVKYLRRHK